MAPLSTAPHDRDSPDLISTVLPDIIETHILTRLDGSTLAAASCASSKLRALCSEERLWRDVCTSTWPSATDPIVRRVISTFPFGHRSFFSDSYPFVGASTAKASTAMLPAELISAVDVRYGGKLIYSKVQAINTTSDWFMCSPFRVELLESKESIPTRIRPFDGRDFDGWTRHLEENLTLSWILIDPSQKRAANVSSWRPVTVRRHWVTGDIDIRYGTPVCGGYTGEGDEVEMAVVVTCVEGEQEEVQVKQVRLQVEEMEGKSLNGRQSLGVFQAAMEGPRSRKEVGGERYSEFEERKRVWRERKERRERATDMACVLFGVALFLGFCSFLLFR